MRALGLVIFLVAVASSASADVFRSTDGGKNWPAAGLAGKAVDELVPDPKDPKVAFALVGANVLNRNELHRTADGGATWTALAPGVETNCLAVDPANTARLWVGGREGSYAHSMDAGKTWTKGSLGDAAKGDLGAKHVRGFAFAGTAVIAVGGQGDGFIARSTDDGKSWAPVTKTQGIGYAWACVAVGDTVYVGADSGLLVSQDAGKTFGTRDAVAAQLGTGGRFCVGPKGTPVVFAFRGTTVQSADGGKSWVATEPPDGVSFVDAVAWAGSASVAITAGGTKITEGPMTMFQPDGSTQLWVKPAAGGWIRASAPGNAKASVVAGTPDGSAIWLGTR